MSPGDRESGQLVSGGPAQLLSHGWWLTGHRLPLAGLDRLWELARILPADVSDRWVSTAIDGSISSAARRDLDLSIREVVAPVVGALLRGYEPFMASMFSKGPGAPGVPFHQDLTYTNEAVARSYVAWVPLVAIEEHNGALLVASGSHVWTEGVRAMGKGGVRPLLDEHNALLELACPIEMAAGEILIFDVALSHASTPNRSDAQRPAVAVNYLPAGTNATICHGRGDGRFDRFAIGDEYLLDPQPFRAEPLAAELIGSFVSNGCAFRIPASLASPPGSESS